MYIYIKIRVYIYMFSEFYKLIILDLELYSWEGY